MKKRLTEEQIIKVIQRNRHGEKAKDLAREIGISVPTFFVLKKKFKDMSVNEAKRLVADLSLDNQMLKEVNSKKWQGLILSDWLRTTRVHAT